MNIQARSGDRNLPDAISTQYKLKAKASFEIAFTIHPKRFAQTCDNDDRVESIRVNFDFNLPQFNATDNQGSLCFVNHAGNIAAFTMAWNRLRIIMQIMCICNVMSVVCSTRRRSVRMFSRRCSSKWRCLECVQLSLFTVVGLTRRRFRPLKNISRIWLVTLASKKNQPDHMLLCSFRASVPFNRMVPSSGSMFLLLWYLGWN